MGSNELPCVIPVAGIVTVVTAVIVGVPVTAVISTVVNSNNPNSARVCVCVYLLS